MPRSPGKTGKKNLRDAREDARIPPWLRAKLDTRICDMVSFIETDFEPYVPPGEPTPEEIASLCAEIRSEWSEETHRERAGLARAPDPVDTMLVDCPPEALFDAKW